MLDAIDRARIQHEFDLWAYVIMPEHVHLLIWPRRSEYSISAILKSLKQSVTRRAVTFLKQDAPSFLKQLEDRRPDGCVSYRFWQRGGGYDRNLTEPSTVWRTIEYLHFNPVRRQLCLRPIDFRWSSAIELAQPGTGDLRLNLESLPRTNIG